MLAEVRWSFMECVTADMLTACLAALSRSEKAGE
jgi:hypothetical protein